jgi:hypothetical protein
MKDVSAMTYETIEEAFYFVSSAPPFENSAVVNRKTGEAYYESGMGGYDEIPKEAEGSDDYIWIPHKNDLDLGKPLVIDFVRDRCPELIDPVVDIFRRKAAYSRYKGLLEKKGLLEEWYAFEERKTREALLKWCEESGIVLE